MFSEEYIEQDILFKIAEAVWKLKVSNPSVTCFERSAKDGIGRRLDITAFSSAWQKIKQIKML